LENKIHIIVELFLGPGLLLVGLYSSLGPCERLVVKRIMASSPGHIYKVSYRARRRGQYMLVILYGSNMQHVPGSPYLVHVEWITEKKAI
jgi:hypothetical protein